MGFGIKRRSRELASRAFNVIVIPEVERYHWPEKSYLQRFLRILDIDCVFDVGANRGQYGKLLRSLGFTGLIVSFEPNPVPYAELLKQRDDKWICFPYGLGSEPGELPFNVMADDVFSSFLSPSGAEEYAAENSVVSTVTVPIKRLKDLLDEIGTSFSRPFLKLDTTPCRVSAESSARLRSNGFTQGRRHSKKVRKRSRGPASSPQGCFQSTPTRR
jgi:FkbM family methyltransferase